MRNIALYFVLFFSIVINAQTNLQFDKRFVECEDRWVSFKMNQDSTYSFGFIYIDPQAGLTFNYEGRFRVSNEGKFIYKKQQTNPIKVRLEPNQVRVALIPDLKFDELGVEIIPEWLQFYKGDTSSVERLYRWGYLYNSWDMCEKALTYLERGRQINPKFKGLELELSYAYNALNQYDKAISVLKGAIKSDPSNVLLYKELSYAELKLGKLDKAEETCSKVINLCDDKSIKSEMAYNIAYEFYKRKDLDKFQYWSNTVRKWGDNGSPIIKALDSITDDLNKK
jgi:tetratricopeptide (TPR) repeat protein